MTNIFIAGEKIDLCLPEEGDFERWSRWFNDSDITKFLEQGKYPNSKEMQRDWYYKAVAAGRFIAMIKDKEGTLLGVISLSDINYEKSWCQIALVCPERSETAKFAPLEAMALCAQHAFDQFGVASVWAGQAFPGLESWGQKLEILGFKTDGVIPGGLRHGRFLSDAVRISLTHDRYLNLISCRDDRLWPGSDIATKLLNGLKGKQSLACEVADAIKELHRKHDFLLHQLERDAHIQ